VLNSDDPAGSLTPRRRALETYEALLAAHPDDREAQRNAALTHKTLGSTLSAMDRLDEARAEILKALALDEGRVRADPNSALARLDLSFDVSLLAYLAASQEDYDGALEYWQRTIEMRKSLVDADPKDARAKGRGVRVPLGRRHAPASRRPSRRARRPEARAGSQSGPGVRQRGRLHRVVRRGSGIHPDRLCRADDRHEVPRP
jgi:tetratricopeptide (TPR) repeat protein